MAAKLPRRTMSMAKRAVKLAEGAADLDLVEGAIGNDGNAKIGAFQFAGAWLAAIVGTVIIIGAVAFACQQTQVSPDWSPPGAQSRETPFYQTGDPTDGRMGNANPFPDARTEDPIVLEVTCPDGTIHIATGPEAVDSVCIQGKLAGVPTPTPTRTRTATPTATTPPGSSIGADTVPSGLACEEDELIGYVNDGTPPFALGCVHVDTFCPLGMHVGSMDVCQPD